MSARRQARAGISPDVMGGAIPPELLSRLHRAWSDADRIARSFPDFIRPSEVETLRTTSAASGMIRDRVLNGWAEANGYADSNGHADWHALRRLGLEGGPAPQGETPEARQRRLAEFQRAIAKLP
ncbi:hypothetical protein NOCA2140036 [metagenome]|uniref:Uncharacterized protein n=1 Tax=metagenome TaxID=256318 RepID=A0A2P2BWW1_9ZZZZ